MKVIVIQQPWAWLIVNGYKDIENRSWATRYRGPLLIQASAGKPSKQVWEDRLTYVRRRGVRLPEKFDFGGIVGIVELDDCVEKSRSKWHEEGYIGWRLSKPKRLPFVAMKGQLSLFEPPTTVLKKLGLKQ
jgi:hypothetical protein